MIHQTETISVELVEVESWCTCSHFVGDLKATASDHGAQKPWSQKDKCHVFTPIHAVVTTIQVFIFGQSPRSQQQKALAFAKVLTGMYTCPVQVRAHKSTPPLEDASICLHCFCTCTDSRSTPVAQSAPRNLLTRWDVSSIPANGIFLTKT